MARRPASRSKAEAKPSLFEPEAAPAAPAPAAKAAPKAAKPRAAAPAGKTTAPAPSPPKPDARKVAKASPSPARRATLKAAAASAVPPAPAAKPAPKAADAPPAPTPKPKAAEPVAAATAPAKAPAAKPAATKAPAAKPPAAATPIVEDMPPRLRAMAERNVEQARSAYADYVGASERMLDALDDGSRKAWSGARDVNLRILGFAEANAKAGFDFAERFLKAGDFAELAKLQRDYLRQTTERLSTQMREIQKLTQDATRAAMPKTTGRDRSRP